MEKTINIYGLKRNDEFIYIGKTESTAHRSKYVNKPGYFPNQMLITEELRNSEGVEIVVLKKLPYGKSKEWYDQKLLEVVDKHKDNHPLLNAEWMKKGYRGYWQNMKRDAHTISRLSESKFKRICEYSKEGHLVKIWDSGKEVAIKVFKDYRIKKGKASSKFYSYVRSRLIESRLHYNSYWIRESEIMQHFKFIPTKLNFPLIIKNQKEDRSMRTHATRKKNYKKRKYSYRTVYTINQFDENNKLIKTYDSFAQAMDELNLSRTSIRRYCNTKIKKPKYYLKYGVKKKVKTLNK